MRESDEWKRPPSTCYVSGACSQVTLPPQASHANRVQEERAALDYARKHIGEMKGRYLRSSSTISTIRSGTDSERIGRRHRLQMQGMM